MSPKWDPGKESSPNYQPYSMTQLQLPVVSCRPSVQPQTVRMWCRNGWELVSARDAVHPRVRASTSTNEHLSTLVSLFRTSFLTVRVTPSARKALCLFGKSLPKGGWKAISAESFCPGKGRWKEKTWFSFFSSLFSCCNIASPIDSRHSFPLSRNKFHFMSPSEEINFCFSDMMIKTAFGIFLSKFVVVYHANSSLHHELVLNIRKWFSDPKFFAPTFLLNHLKWFSIWNCFRTSDSSHNKRVEATKNFPDGFKLFCKKGFQLLSVSLEFPWKMPVLHGKRNLASGRTCVSRRCRETIHWYTRGGCKEQS